MKVKFPDLLFILLISIFISMLIGEYYATKKFFELEIELINLRYDHDTIKRNLDTVKYSIDTLKSNSDTVLRDVRDLKKGQQFIYDEVKKDNSSNFLDLFQW